MLEGLGDGVWLAEDVVNLPADIRHRFGHHVKVLIVDIT